MKMADVMIPSNNNAASSKLQQQKSGVKTLSIIDTISELATDKTEASRLTLPSPVRVINHPGVPPRNPKVSVPLSSPLNTNLGAKPRFVSSSPKKTPPPAISPKLNLSAIQQNLSVFNVNTNAATSQNQPQQQQNRDGQTPDWIRDIFHHAKRGNREKLEMATRGLEPTLIRNLTDHLGNNLLHTVCSAGHMPLLPFLTSRFANELNGALNDENRKGLTPVQAAIKLGRLECVQWLVRHSSLRDKLTSRDGDRSLLHQAAKYGKEDLVSWLGEEMSHQGLDVDQLDIAANSPLHLAAKHGHISSVSALLHFGAQVALKNDMGLKAHDCAKLMGQKECAEFLILYETSLEMASELSEVQSKREMLLVEHNELRTYFKDVLTIGKRLAKERDEMCRELRRLHESTLELHDKMILEIQALSKHNVANPVIQACNALHEKWQNHSRLWLNTTEAEHKLWIAEESWRKVKTSTSGSSGPSSLDNFYYPQRHLRDRLEVVKGRSLALPSASGVAALASSDEEDISENSEQISNDYEDVVDSKISRIHMNISQRKKLATPSPSHKNESKNSLNESIYSLVSNEQVYSKISPNQSVATQQKSGLVSANGTASVIEVIEPTASEEEEFKEALKEMNWTASPVPLGQHSPITIFPRDELRSSIMTTASASPNFHARPAQIRSSTSSKGSRSSAKYSSNGEISPTKRLLEMGINADNMEANDENVKDGSNEVVVKRNFFQKIAHKTNKLAKRSPVSPPLQMYANISNGLQHEIEKDEEELEEHILPENFDEEEDEEETKTKSSVSPSSRKSASSHVSKNSEDSGIGIQKAKNATASVMKQQVIKKIKSPKAWYDVPSDDDTEAPEADSLASIISHRGSSDDEI